MATARVKGILIVSQNEYFRGVASENAKNTYAVFGDGIENPQAVAVQDVYIWEGVNEWTFEFAFASSATNLVQNYWNQLTDGGSGPHASGVLEIQLGTSGANTKYLFFPKRSASYFTSTGSVITCILSGERPRVRTS